MASSSAIPISFDSKRDEPSDVHPKANPRDTVSALLFDGISLTQLARTVPSSLVSKRASNDDDLWRLVSWSVKVAATVAKHGLKESECAELRYGNPQDEPIEGIVDLFANAARPPRGREIDWFAYSFPDLADLKAVAGRLSKLRGFNYHAEDIIVTDGSLAALDLLVFACTDPGDEVIILSPVYFNYPIIIRHREAVPIIVPVRPDNFEPDVDALRRAITPRTKAIIVNSPNNPTGVLYSRESLVELSDMLIEVNATRASPILVISDEAYCRILYDGVTYVHISAFVPLN
jgi:aspartate aminotransferase